jgi:branched-chain amino acid transport system ATP-binding protein
MSAVLEIGDLTVGPGEIVAVLGGNGAGKTSLLETILGFRPGPVRLFGRDVAALAVEQRVLMGVGYVPERRRVFAGLTVQENLEAASSLPADQRRQRAAEMMALFPMLGERPRARAWLLSGGQQQMLALARALMLAPKILLVDEPSVGLSPLLVSRTIDTIRELKSKYQLTVLMAEQNFNQAIRIADSGYVIVHGKIAFSGKSADELNNNDLIRKFYLGL